MSAVLAFALVASASQAEPLEPALASLKWHAPSGCMQGAGLRRAVEARLGRAAFVAPSRADLRITGTIARTDTGWKSTIALADAAGLPLGTRDLESRAESCSALDEPVALVVALAVDGWTERAPPPDRAPPQRTLAGIATAAAFVLGRLPGVGTGLDMSAGVAPGSLVPLEAALTIWAPAETGSRIGARFTAWDARAVVCPLAFGSLHACVGAEGGTIHATGAGLDFNDDPTRMRLALVGRVALFLPVWEALGIALSAGAAAPLWRHRFYYSDPEGRAEVVHTEWPLVVGASAGAALHFSG